MTIRFRCPHCQKPLGVKDHLAGKKAACPQCKKVLVIPKAAAPSVPTSKPAPNGTAPPEAVPERPPEELESLAAEALNDPPPDLPKQQEAGTIDFTCDFCEHELHVPREEAGKRLPCPECKNILRVPTPKEEKPKDWRDVAKKGPTIANLTQPEKISEDAWGTQTDKGRVSRVSLEEAEALPEVTAKPVGVRGWIRRGLWGALGVAVLVLAVIGASRVHRNERQKDDVAELRQLIEAKGGAALEKPLLRAEVYRALGEYNVRNQKHFKAMDHLKNALATARGSSAKGPDHDLFLRDLALTHIELGGTEEERINKEKYYWKDEVQKELLRTLSTIRSPEARVLALRDVATRLLEKGQGELAVGLAAQLKNAEAGYRSLLLSQQIALMLALDQKEQVDALAKEPDPSKEVRDTFARVGYAEYYARKGDVAKALELVQARGPARDRLEASVGVTAVLLANRADPKAVEAAVPFVDESLRLAGEARAELRKLPWLTLQVIQQGARVKGPDAVKDLAKNIDPAFRPRAYLEILRAESAKAVEPLAISALGDVEFADKEATALDLAWLALARQHARFGQTGDIQYRARESENGRFQPMVAVGVALGELDRAGK